MDVMLRGVRHPSPRGAQSRHPVWRAEPAWLPDARSEGGESDGRPEVFAAAGVCPRVMLVVSDPVRRRTLSQAFEKRALPIIEPSDRGSLTRLAKARAADVIIVDTDLPGEDPFDICRSLHALRAPPMILVMRDPDEADRIAALEVGADDCVPQTMSARELLARVRALARRGDLQREIERRERGTSFAFAGWRLCLTTRALRGPDNRVVYLATAEVALLGAFLENPGEVLARDRLRALMGVEDEKAGCRLVDWRVSRLRARLGDALGEGAVIKTVKGRGYMFNAEVRAI